MNKTEKIATAISLGMTLLQIFMYFKADKTNARLAKAEERIADALEKKYNGYFVHTTLCDNVVAN